MRLLDLNTGSMYPPAALLRHADSALDARGRPWLVARVLMVWTEEDGWVAIDTGFGEMDLAQPSRRLGRAFALMAGLQSDASAALVRQLARERIPLADVRHVLVTHLDLDHAGGLVDLPHATVHAAAAELAAATARASATDRSRYLAHHLQHGPRWQPLGEATGERFDLVSGPVDGLSDRFCWFRLPGHTAGHTGYGVHLPDGRWLCMVGDAVLEVQEITHPHPHRTAAIRGHHRLFDHDAAQAGLVRERLRRAHLTWGSEIVWVNSHDPRWSDAALQQAAQTGATLA
jgi:glyoxylase-like metal-dependent hydrolase (beta-lactamase superfamily II)